MSTPVEQVVPEEFQNELDLPATMEIDQFKLTGAKAGLQRYRVEAGALNSQVNYYTAKAKATKDPLTKARYEAQAALARTKLTAAQGRQTAAQTKVYELSGQWDKLLTGANRDAFSALKAMFDQFGLGTLAGKIYEYTKQGFGAATISLLLQDTREYK